jgi:hypothetical protein
MPLVAGKLPYTAGIKGHQGAVVGDQPGWLDVQLKNILDPGYGGGNPIGWIAALNGVELPESADNDVDQQWLDYYNDYIKSDTAEVDFLQPVDNLLTPTAVVVNNEIGFDA